MNKRPEDEPAPEVDEPSEEDLENEGLEDDDDDEQTAQPARSNNPADGMYNPLRYEDPVD